MKKLFEKEIMTEEEYVKVKGSKKSLLSKNNVRAVAGIMATIILGSGTYALVENSIERRNQKIQKRIDEEYITSKNDFDGSVAYSFDRAMQENMENFIHSIDTDMRYTPLTVTTNYALEYVENNGSWWTGRYKTYDMEFNTTYMYKEKDMKKFIRDGVVYVVIDRGMFDISTMYKVKNVRETLKENGKPKSGAITSNERLNTKQVEIEQEKTRLLVHNSLVTDEYINMAIEALQNGLKGQAMEYGVKVEFQIDGRIESHLEYGSGDTDIKMGTPKLDIPDSQIETRTEEIKNKGMS